MMFEASAECCSAKTCEFSNFPNCNILPQPQAACVNHPNMELISGIDKQQFLIFSYFLFQNHIDFSRHQITRARCIKGSIDVKACTQPFMAGHTKFFKWAIPCLFFVVLEQYHRIRTVNISRIRTWTVRVEGEHSDHLTTTTTHKQSESAYSDKYCYSCHTVTYLKLMYINVGVVKSILRLL